MTSERVGIAAAILSSTLGGMAAATTRFVVADVDPIAIAAFRFGIGAMLLLPMALAARVRWPQGKDWIGTGLLGLALYAGFFVIYNVAFGYTTAARGALAISTLSLLTMLVAALLGAENLTARKSSGVLVAIAGVAIALVAGLQTAPEGAWRGDLLMLAGVLTMAFFNVLSRPLIARSSPLGFVSASMAVGAASLVALTAVMGGHRVVQVLNAPQWVAIAYLGVFGGAAAFYLWIFALQKTTPTRVANTGTVTPIAAAMLAAAILSEPIGLNLIVGLAMVALGIWLASTDQPAM
jgi:drug/metabolite transporter (DMT)-like permease